MYIYLVILCTLNSVALTNRTTTADPTTTHSTNLVQDTTTVQLNSHSTKGANKQQLFTSRIITLSEGYTSTTVKSTTTVDISSTLLNSTALITTPTGKH